VWTSTRESAYLRVDGVGARRSTPSMRSSLLAECERSRCLGTDVFGSNLDTISEGYTRPSMESDTSLRPQQTPN
jgi:hypothetical protein